MPLSFLQARAIGGFLMRDEKGVDEKIICVHEDDPAVRDYTEMGQLPQHVVAEMMRFFEDYKALEGKGVEVGEAISRAEAVGIVRAAAQRYREKYPR